MSESLLVTGAGGFVGRHVVARAEARGWRATEASGDLRDAGAAREAVAVAAPAAVIHLASRRPAPGDDPWSVLEDELAMAGNLLRAVDELAPGAAVLMPGTAGQYGPAANGALAEDAPCRPLTAYAAVKCVLEAACLAPALRGRARVIWARSFNFVGPGQGLDAPVPAWARQLAAAERAGGGVLRTGRLDVVRDFLDVRDVADAYLDLVAGPAEGVVNVGSGVAVALQEVVDVLVGLTRAEVSVERDESLLRPDDPQTVVADVSRLRELTGFAPRIPLRASLEEVLECAR